MSEMMKLAIFAANRLHAADAKMDTARVAAEIRNKLATIEITLACAYEESSLDSNDFEAVGVACKELRALCDALGGPAIKPRKEG